MLAISGAQGCGGWNARGPGTSTCPRALSPARNGRCGGFCNEPEKDSDLLPVRAASLHSDLAWNRGVQGDLS